MLVSGMANKARNQSDNTTNGVNPGFWRGKRVLVTGHSGLKGSWLSTWLMHMNAKVLGLSLEASTKPNMFGALGLAAQIEQHICDIRNYDESFALITKFDPEIIIHLAAQSIVSIGYKDPLLTLSTNIMGSAHVLQAALACRSLQSILMITSDKCYRPHLVPSVNAHTESDALGGFEPYSASKACAETVIEAYRESFFKTHLDKPTLMSARAGNIFAGGDWSTDRLVPDAIRAFQEKQPLFLRSPHYIRPWQHILDPLRGYLLLAEKGYHSNAFGSAWNFGPPKDHMLTVKTIADMFCEKWGDGAKVESQDGSPAFKETSVLRIDSEKARSGLSWQPSISLRDGVAITVEWYKAFYEQQSSQKMLDHTIEQIETFGMQRSKKRHSA